MWITENEGAMFWLNVLTEPLRRGLEGILIACVDRLKGVPDAINTMSWKDYKLVTTDLKRVYRSSTEEESQLELERIGEIWGDQYPQISKSWRTHWQNLNTLFNYADEIRKAINTTNAIESLNSVIHRAIYKRKTFARDDSAKKMVYLVIKEASKKWSILKRNWRQAMSSFIIEFEERLEKHIN